MAKKQKGKASRGARKRDPRLLAPILIPTCNRFEHFRNLVTTLQACPLAGQTRLYIALDAPFSGAVKKDHLRIVRWVKDLRGFGGVTIWRRPENWGSWRNIRKARQDIFQRHERLILLEDDNMVARNFLLFMNQAMDALGSDPRCFAVCGYHLEPAVPAAPAVDFYRAPYYIAWGAGLFRDRFASLGRLRGRRPDAFFANPWNLWRMSRTFPHLFRLYMEAWLLGKNYGDISLSLRCQERGWYVAYPALTKVINRGFDGSGEHCRVSSQIFHEAFAQEDQTSFDFTPCPAADRFFQRRNRDWFRNHFAVPARHTLSLYWRYLTRLAGLRPSSPLRE